MRFLSAIFQGFFHDFFIYNSLLLVVELSYLFIFTYISRYLYIIIVLIIAVFYYKNEYSQLPTFSRVQARFEPRSADRSSTTLSTGLNCNMFYVCLKPERMNLKTASIRPE